MNKGGRPPVLDSMKRAEILTIISIGCSRRAAARYVGCAPSTIGATARRDPDFAQQLARAEQRSQIGLITCIREAGKKAQSWRAAAWALERMNPEDFAPRGPDVVSGEQIRALMEQLAQALAEHIPVARYRKELLRTINCILEELP